MSIKRRGGASSSKLTFGLGTGEEEMHEQLAKSQLHARVGDPELPTYAKSIVNHLNSQGQIERLAFEVDPTQHNGMAGVYQAKYRLIPDSILKRIAIQDSLVSNIVRARQNHISAFGRPRPDRFSNGFIIKPNTGIREDMDENGKLEFDEQVERAQALLATCGHTAGLTDDHQSTFSEYLSLSARSAVVVGRIATEVVWVDDPAGGSDDNGNPRKKFHHFMATDAGTVYKATNDQSAAEQLREQAYFLLCQLAGRELSKERFHAGEYTWVQLVEGRPLQAFTSDEMKVYNFYAVPDVELGGYPVTPIDTVISAVTTHINITTHNRLYFQSGRASRGMLVIKSDDAGPNVVHSIKQQFNASINNVNNSWRMPVFGCGTEEEITWQPIDSGGGRDMEFQYLTDMNAREILTAFMMSPDELPGWSYLSRGTNNQALSEGNNEYKLQAARDVGIRPLLAGFEDFINKHILPLIDPDLATKAQVKLMGLDADNAEKEAVRTVQDMGIWMTFDDVNERVEKKPVGRKWLGAIPLNPTYQAMLDKYLTVAEVLAHFCDRPEALQDPRLDYRPNPFWFQQLQWMSEQQQMQQQAQQAQQPGGGGAPGGGGSGSSDGPKLPGQSDDSGGDSGGDAKGGKAFDAKTEHQKTDSSEGSSAAGSPGGDDLARSIDIAFDHMLKSERDLPPNKRRILAQRRQTIDHFMRGLVQDSGDAIDAIMSIAEHHAPKK